MTDWTKLLRLQVQADKEAKITAVTVTGTPTKFVSQLANGETRKSISAYNNSPAASGECYYGFSPTMEVSGESMPIPQGSVVDIPIADTSNIDLYFMCISGELGDLRVEELA